MKFKIPFEDATGVYISSLKELNEHEEKQKTECLNKLCNLIDLKEIGYIRNQHKYISVKRLDGFLLVEIEDNCQA